jgi:hypothetical protein
VTVDGTTSRRETLHRHPQDQQRADPHHPQPDVSGVRNAVHPGMRAEPRHPQRAQCPARDPDGRGPSHGRGDDAASFDHDTLDRPEARSGAQRCEIQVPAPGALRPLARALLSIAADVHAARGEARRIACPKGETTLRMESSGLRHPLRSPAVSGVLPPATPERSPSGDASSHVSGAPPPPVENSDCIGDCA